MQCLAENKLQIQVVNNFFFFTIGISLKQIYTITSDNARNMIKATELIRNELQSQIDHETESEEEENDQFNYQSVDNAASLLITDSKTCVNCIRCAAHTLQLVVTDAIKESNLANNINECRKIAIALRKQTISAKLKSENLRLSKLNVPTRWNSTYDMIDRLIELKEFCMDNRVENVEFDVPEQTWQFMSEFKEVFEPIKIATLQMQSKDMPLGDFYKIWLKLKIEIKKKSSPIKDALLTIIEKREKCLLENTIVLAALYLDPRFHFLLTVDQKEKAQNHLKSLYANLVEMENQPQSQNDVPFVNQQPSSGMENLVQNCDNEEDEVDDLVAYLNEKENEQRGTNSNYYQNFDLEITNFLPERLCDHTINIINYWDIKSQQYPVLSKLAKIVHSVPATQVTVERSFSTLRWILSDLRNRLTTKNLENILMVNLNNEFTIN